MKTVLSASRRTDIPAYYLNWFIDAVDRGYVDVRNPVYRKTVSRVLLDPDQVEWIVFWSRNFGPFLRHRAFFKNYKLFFHFTIIPASILEKHPVPIETSLKQIAELAVVYGPEQIVWRYDPIAHWLDSQNRICSNHSLIQFEQLCKAINRTGVKTIYTSFVSLYEKFRMRFKRALADLSIFDPQLQDKQKILAEMTEITNRLGMTIHSCCNDDLLVNPAIRKGHCINGPLLNRLDPAVKISTAKAPSREACGCTKSIDIGDYLLHPCPTGCIYCYANPQGY